MEKKNFVHCPALNCDEPIKGSWKQLLTGESNEKGRPYYKCPMCNNIFTVDDLKVNAIPVPEEEGDVFLFDIYSKKIVFQVLHEMKFTDGEAIYVHVPQALTVKPNIKCYHIKVDDSITNKQLEDMCLLFYKQQGGR